MNEHILNGRWNQLKGQVRKTWGKLTNDDLDMIQGDIESLIGKIEERYGRSREEIEAEVDDWLEVHLLTPESAKLHGTEEPY